MNFGEKKGGENYSGATSKAPAPKPKYTPFTPSESARVSVALENALLRSPDHACRELELKKTLLNDPGLRPLMMNVGAVNNLVDSLEAEGLVNPVARNELGTLALTPKYFAQFRHPQKMKSLVENTVPVSAGQSDYPAARRYLS